MSKLAKSRKEELQKLQTSLDNLEQYTQKNSLEFRGIPEGINLSTDEIVYSGKSNWDCTTVGRYRNFTPA